MNHLPPSQDPAAPHAEPHEMETRPSSSLSQDEIDSLSEMATVQVIPVHQMETRPITSILETQPMFALAETQVTKRPSLRTNFSWVFGGQMVYLAAQWGIVVVLAQFGTPEIVGRFGLGLAISAPVYAFINLGLNNLLATDARDQFYFGEYFALRILSIIAAVIAIVGIGFGAGYAPEVVAVIAGIGLAKGFESGSDILYGLLQKRERMNYIAYSTITKGILTIVGFGGAFILTDSIIIASWSLAAVWGIILVAVDLRYARRVMPNWRSMKPILSGPRLRHLAWHALPLGISMIAIALTTNIPRYIIESSHGEALLGYFTAIIYILTATSSLFAALQKATSPRMATYYTSHRHRDLLKLLGQLIIGSTFLGVAGVVGAILLGEIFLRWFYGADYAAQSEVLVWLMVSLGPAYIFGFLASAMIVMRLLRARLLISILAAILTFGIGLVLIPPFDLLGAMWTILIVSVVNVILAGLFILYRLIKGDTRDPMPAM